MLALRGWFELVRPPGYLVIVVPDEDLYEQGTWPSRFNCDHRWTFTIAKRWSWSPRSLNIIDVLLENLSGFSLVRVGLLDEQYDYAIVGTDQSCGPAEVAIEVILQKHPLTVSAPR